MSFRDIGKRKAKNEKKRRKENFRLIPVSPHLSDENGPGGPGAAGLPGRAGEYIFRHRRLRTRFGSALLSLPLSRSLSFPSSFFSPSLLQLLFCVHRRFLRRYPGTFEFKIFCCFSDFFPPSILWSFIRALDHLSSVGDSCVLFSDLLVPNLLCFGCCLFRWRSRLFSVFLRQLFDFLSSVLDQLSSFGYSCVGTSDFLVPGLSAFVHFVFYWHCNWSCRCLLKWSLRFSVWFVVVVAAEFTFVGLDLELFKTSYVFSLELVLL